MTITDPTDPDYDYEADATAEDEAEHLFDPAHEVKMTPRHGNGPKSVLAVRLDGAVIDQLRVMASSQGVGITQLVRHWITERMSSEGHDPTSPANTLDKVIGELNEIAASLRAAGAKTLDLSPDDIRDSSPTSSTVRPVPATEMSRPT